jgi:hypothetical protein
MSATLVHAFDIETSGPRIGKHSLMSIAACCMEIPLVGPPVRFDTFCVTINWPDGLVFDDATRQFWLAHPTAYEFSTTNTTSPEKAANLLYEHIHRTQLRAKVRNNRYVIVTDNAFYDIPWIDWFLCQYTEYGMPLRHNYYTGWIKPAGVVDLTERLKALNDVGININMTAFKASVFNNHVPINDAIVLAERYIFYKQSTHALKIKTN